MWWKRKEDKTIESLVTIVIQQGEIIMATLVEVQANAVALQTAFDAEQARQAAKNAAFQSAVDAGVAALAVVQAELITLKAGGQTPENQVIIDDISAKIVNVTTGLHAAAV